MPPAAITSGGAIPDNSLYAVVAEPDGLVVGTVDEDFAVESNRGDIMLPGNTSWMIRRIETNSGRVTVQDAHGAPKRSLLARRSAGANSGAFRAHWKSAATHQCDVAAYFQWVSLRRNPRLRPR